MIGRVFDCECFVQRYVACLNALHASLFLFGERNVSEQSVQQSVQLVLQRFENRRSQNPVTDNLLSCVMCLDLEV